MVFFPGEGGGALQECWGIDFDNSGPSEIEGHGEFPAKDAIWNTATKYRITLKYPNNITMVMAGGHPDIKGGTKWIVVEQETYPDGKSPMDCTRESLAGLNRLLA